MVQTGDISVVLTDQSILLQELFQFVGSAEAGAIASFVGTTRNHFGGKKVVSLEYEAYIPMAEKQLWKICETAKTNWSLIAICIHHKIGMCPVGDIGVAITVSSAHRLASMEAVRYIIDTLKQQVPIWKREIYEDGSSSWKENCECFWSCEKESNAQPCLDGDLV